MSWVLIGQSVDVVLSAVLLLRLVQVHLHWKYLLFLLFVACDGTESLAYLIFRAYRPFDFRLFYLGSLAVTWCTTICMVYALMTAIMSHLTGIRRFCIWFLNVVFLAWVVVSLSMSAPQWLGVGSQSPKTVLAKLVVLAQSLDRAFSLAEILVMLSILCFVLRFPVQVSRNLAAFTAGIAVYLFARVSLLLLLTYIPASQGVRFLPSFLTLIIVACLLYWIFTTNEVGETTEVTLGFAWHSLPPEHIVRQLDALNTALLTSREQSNLNVTRNST